MNNTHDVTETLLMTSLEHYLRRHDVRYLWRHRNINYDVTVIAMALIELKITELSPLLPIFNKSLDHFKNTINKTEQIIGLPFSCML